MASSRTLRVPVPRPPELTRALGRASDELLTRALTGLASSSDAPADAVVAVATRHVVMEPRHFGEFKVPGLRGLEATAPYFHDGSAPSIEDVVRHYSELDETRLHADGVRLLQALKLTPAQAADLVAFLKKR